MESAGVIRGVSEQATADGGRAIIVRLGGEVDLHRSPQVRNELMKRAAERPAHLVVDLAEVEYMDSSGVASLVEALKRVVQYKGQLTLAAPNERVRSIFQIARLDAIFRIVPSLSEALSQ